MLTTNTHIRDKYQNAFEQLYFCKFSPPLWHLLPISLLSLSRIHENKTHNMKIDWWERQMKTNWSRRLVSVIDIVWEKDWQFPNGCSTSFAYKQIQSLQRIVNWKWFIMSNETNCHCFFSTSIWSTWNSTFLTFPVGKLSYIMKFFTIF